MLRFDYSSEFIVEFQLIPTRRIHVPHLVASFALRQRGPQERRQELSPA
jgi:hypothetical protein